MDFGAGFGTGIAVGIASGIASGSASAKKQEKMQLRTYIEENGIEILDRYGKPIKLDDFLNGAVNTSSECCSRKKAWVCVLLAVALVIGVAGVVVVKSFGIL